MSSDCRYIENEYIESHEIPTSPISRRLDEPWRLIDTVAERLPFSFPPEVVAPVAEVDEMCRVRGAWVVKLTVHEHLPAAYDPEDDYSHIIPTWEVYIGHDAKGDPIDARLVRGHVRILDYDLHSDFEPAHYDHASLDPVELVQALARNSSETSPDHHDPALAVETWRGTVAGLIAKRQQVPPQDLLPRLADGTISVCWGESGAWLGKPGALVPERVSIDCVVPGEVIVIFDGSLHEGDQEAEGIADDLADALRRFYARAFKVRVYDRQTEIRVSSF